MPLYDVNDVLINHGALDSGTDGDGTGTDETASGGRIIDVTERQTCGVMAILRQPAADPAADGATLDIKLDVSVDGGSTWLDNFFVFRQITGAEVPDDSAGGDLPLIMAGSMTLPAADTDQDGVVKVRASTVASATTDWSLFLTLVPLQSILGVHRDRAFAAAT